MSSSRLRPVPAAFRLDKPSGAPYHCGQPMKVYSEDEVRRVWLCAKCKATKTRPVVRERRPNHA